MCSSVPPAMSDEDLLTHIEVVKVQELNQMVEDREVDRWDPMTLEASTPLVFVKPPCVDCQEQECLQFCSLIMHITLEIGSPLCLVNAT